jgi:trans-2,3-dihydro-3-hydroxyanthranilate isomerase
MLLRMEKTLRYRVLDVFTERRREGNPLAVFLDGSGLDASVMQSIARELSLSETVFVFPPARADCAARLRIFTPRKEMDFAGHPTIGTAFALLDDGRVSPGAAEFLLEENVGPIHVGIEHGGRPLIWLTTPTISEGPAITSAAAAGLLSLPTSSLLAHSPQILDAGNPTLFVPLMDRHAVDGASLDSAEWSTFKTRHPGPMCVFAFTPTPEGAYSRMFAPDYGIAEDPATGSSTGPLAAFMMRHGLAPSADGSRFRSEQGTSMGRRSILHVRVQGDYGCDGIAVGGYVTPIVDGVMTL